MPSAPRTDAIPVPVSQDMPPTLVAWYGDDFTGAAATLEVLSFAGVPSLLFLDTPSAAQLARHPGLRAIGVASTARTKSPEWMADHLPQTFDQLLALKPGLLHYKICSTLDSSPECGSIGAATEIGASAVQHRVVPLMVAAPEMKRYQCFGQLFAEAQGKVHRLDRHPVMARHPVTPMTESDVARHVCAQSDRLDGHVLTLPEIALGPQMPPPPTDPARIALVTLDSVDAASDTAIGGLLWQGRRDTPFVVGSQGVEYALVQHWRATGALPMIDAPEGIGRSKGMISVSGSLSPSTADQIRWARAHGFATIPFDATAAVKDEAAQNRAVETAVRDSLDALSQGLDPLVYSAEGPDDPSVTAFRRAVATADVDIATANDRVGAALGQVLKRVLDQTGIRRAIASGGDTSGHVTQGLGIYALSALAPTIPGASIFGAKADGPLDGLELALKGGQMGSADYFGWVRDGGGTR